MGYDIECIIDIHTYPGEYFCPVCRTLVFPNEALQAQCTHLYCKSCLSHVANTTRACPYDGYLVTESDSKPLVESDKALADNIGKVKVHCLFFRSGCSWQGSVSECNSHCSACSFGNSAVICNRCGVQIVHRQVNEHAQTCAGGYKAQQANATGSSTTAVDVKQAVTQPQNTQTSNQQVKVSSQSAAAVVPGAVPMPEQWYQQQQQQYQQYHHQYPGYQPYQQPAQQYYPPQQYQQPPVPVQAPTQPNVHSQAQLPPQNPTHPVPQIPQQPYFQPQAHTQAPVQGHQQQTQTQVQVTPQVTPIQVSHPNYQMNQQLPQPPTRPPQAQIPSQTLPPQPHTYPQQTTQHVQDPQYNQSQPSQAHTQPQMHPQPLNQPPPRPQPLSQPHVQVQSYHPQSQPYLRPPPPLPQVPHPHVPPVSGHHSYQQPQPTQHASNGSLNPVPARGHAMQPPPHGTVPQQLLPTVQSQVPSPQNQQFRPHVHQPTHPFQQRPDVQPSQQTFPQQQPFRATFPGQSHERGHFPHQPMQPRPPYQTPQFQHPPNYVRPMAPNTGVHQQTVPQSGSEAGLVPHSGPMKQTSIDLNNGTRLERNPMKQEQIEGQNGNAGSGADAKNDELPSIKQEEHRSLEQISGGKSSEAGMQDGKLREEESDLSKMLSSESNKQSQIAASSSITETNGVRLNSHASTLQRQQAPFLAHSPFTPGPKGPGSREPGYVGPPASNFESHSSNQGPRFVGPNGGSALKSSMFGWHEKQMTFGGEQLEPLPSNHPSDKPHGHVGNFGPAHMKYFGTRSGDREYLGISPRGFDGFSNLPEINGQDAFHEGRFPSSFGNRNRTNDFLGQDFGRGSFDGIRNSYPIPHAASYPGSRDSFDMSRKRRPMSAGWCRICKIDCESGEGLDGHSQTREHQNMAMDMVKMIKQQNKMRQSATAGNISQGGGKVRKVGIDYHGNRS